MPALLFGADQRLWGQHTIHAASGSCQVATDEKVLHVLSLIRARRRIFGRMEYQVADGLAVLERTPPTVRAMLAGLPSQWIDATEGPETWSPYVIVGHMIHGERADWVTRARIILERGEHRTFAPFDRLAQFRESEGKTLAQLLDEFQELRAQNLDTVRAWELTEAQLELFGEHPAFGAVTLRQLLATWTAHDLGHIAQIARVMAKQYAHAVGPWREYLPVMDR